MKNFERLQIKKQDRQTLDHRPQTWGHG